MTPRWKIKQGDTWAMSGTWCNPIPGGTDPDLANPVDLTGWTAKLQLRVDSDSPALLDLTSDPPAGIEVDGPAGVVTTRATPTQTEAIPPGHYRWEVEVSLIQDGVVLDRHTIVEGTLRVDAQVTV